MCHACWISWEGWYIFRVVLDFLSSRFKSTNQTLIKGHLYLGFYRVLNEKWSFKMRIAVVGGGYRCSKLIDVIKQHSFKEINPEIIAVADLKTDVPGMIKARKMGFVTTNDYNDFFKRDDIDLIIELTGSMDIYNDILSKKNKNVRAISDHTANLFWEISRISTKQKITDQKLHDAKALYQAVLNTLSHEDVLVISMDYKIIDVNQSLLNRLSLSRDEVIGRYCYEITHHQNSPCSGEHHPCPLIRTAETKKPFKTTHVHLDKNKKEIHYSISTYPLLEEGDVIGAIEISSDITTDINIQKVMMHQEKLASVGRLSAGVAHEINNPLTTILTSAMLIQEDMDPKNPIYAELETIASETLRCRKIVMSLLDFARQTKPVKKMNNITDIINESILLTRKQAAFKDVSVVKAFEDLDILLYVDKGQIEQALINLILNAAEATPPGGTIHVDMIQSINTNAIKISVKDEGEGIPNEHLDKLFDPFFTTKETGTGLGLSITHGIIEQHGGKINVASRLKKGTTFTICLPLEKGKEYGC